MKYFQLNLNKPCTDLLITLFGIIVVFSCSDEPKNLNSYCPLQQFGITWRDVGRYNCEYEVITAPCSRDSFGTEKQSLFGIGKDGNAKIFFEGRFVQLIPDKIKMRQGTPYWSQAFRNDTLGIELFIDNRELAKESYLHNYYYKSNMVFKARGRSFKYELKGICDSLFIDSLRLLCN
jgi:hypothetical protein